jgi:hypothetical protein
MEQAFRQEAKEITKRIRACEGLTREKYRMLKTSIQNCLIHFSQLRRWHYFIEHRTYAEFTEDIDTGIIPGQVFVFAPKNLQDFPLAVCNSCNQRQYENETLFWKVPFDQPLYLTHLHFLNVELICSECLHLSFKPHALNDIDRFTDPTGKAITFPFSYCDSADGSYRTVTTRKRAFGYPLLDDLCILGNYVPKPANKRAIQ